MISFPSPSSSRKRFNSRETRRGFTLMEILVVITIGTILTSVSIMGFSGIQSEKFTGSLSRFSDYLKQAQILAQASNSYVWVGIAQNQNDPTSLDVVALQGITGCSTDLANGLTRPISKPLQLSGIVINSALTPTPPTPDGNAATALPSTSDLGTFSYSVGGTSQTFSQVIGITPSGQTFVSANTLPHWIQVGLSQYQDKKLKNVGALNIAGLTGKVVVYRP